MTTAHTDAITWRMLTPGTHAGAIAMFWLHASDAASLQSAMQRMQLRDIAVGNVALRTLFAIDEALIARVNESTLLLMPHGSVAGCRAIARHLQANFGDAAPDTTLARSAYAWFPEARSEVEARALLALSRTSSRLAVDVLLTQHDLWSRPDAASSPARDAAMNHLLTPPLVVAIGPSNIGKSTLINALAQRHVSIVADEPGTTRDHVGVLLDCAGLTVQYVDTPGLRETTDAEELAARARALQLASRAALLILCGDATTPPPAASQFATIPHLTVALRSDRGQPSWPADIHTCAATGAGLLELIATIRETLVPPHLLSQQQPWKFW